MAYDSLDLSGLDVTQPDDVVADASEIGTALRETRRLLRDLLRVAHNDDGSLKALSGALITAGTLIGTSLAAKTVTGDKLADDFLSAAHIPSKVITGGMLADNFLQLAHIASGLITSDKIQSLDAGKLSGSIPSGRFGAGTIPVAALISGITSGLISGLDFSKITGVADGKILISVSGTMTAVTPSGAISISPTGVVTLQQALQFVGFGQLLARGQNGGQATTTWTERTITEVADVDALMSISGTAFTLAAGRYLCFARAPACGVGRHQAGLFIDDTTDAILLWGSSAFAPGVRDSADTGTENLQTDSIICGEIEVAATDQLVFKHWVQTSTGTDVDLGKAASSDNTVNLGTHNEVHLRGYFIRLGDAS